MSRTVSGKSVINGKVLYYNKGKMKHAADLAINPHSL